MTASHLAAAGLVISGGKPLCFVENAVASSKMRLGSGFSRPRPRACSLLYWRVVPASPSYIHAAQIEPFEALYNRGHYVAAHTLAVARHGPLENWRAGTAALTFGARLAGNLGGEQVAHALILRARRGAAADGGVRPADRAAAAFVHALGTFGRRGPLALRRFLQRPGVRAAFEAAAEPNNRADVLCLHAHVAAAYRDTDAVEARWQEAHALAPERAWTWCERATLLVASDRYEEALAAADESLRLRPWFRPAVQGKAQILALLGQDDQAVALLEDALDPHQGTLESSAVAAQLAQLYAAMLQPEDVLRTLGRFEGLAPLQEDKARLWVASCRGDALLQQGQLGASADVCEPFMTVSFFHAKTVPRLRAPERQEARRLVHAVPFIRQHQRTCAPATLAALSHFWGRPADQAAITAEICYGGTFDHRERHWAETHGWAVREFRADWTGALELIDAGIPFALVTTAINSGHLQAVIGYDARRGTLIIRDPYERHHAEQLAEEFLAGYAFWGPRAMAIVPADDDDAVARLHAANLPESTLHDGIYRLRRALHGHDGATARRELAALQTQAPGERLTLFAQRELAYYDGDAPALLGAVEGLLALFPHEGRLRLEKLEALRRLARPAEARAWLETCAADGAYTEPNLWRELAQELASDPHQHARARQLLARSLFYEPTEPQHVRALAEICWGERDHAEATALFRLAATAAETRENYWHQFFIASRQVRATDDALRLLEARFQRLGDRSAQPARTLHWAYRERHEFAPAAAVLQEALRLRPDDGELLIFAATAQARAGEHAAAAAFLQLARGHAAPGAVSRAAAEVAEFAGDFTGALGHWRDLLAREPLDALAHEAVVRLLAATDPRGAAASREHLDTAVARFPHAVALHELRIGALGQEPGRGSPEHAAAVAELLEVQPVNVWALRECAQSAEANHRFDLALSLLKEAERLDPFAPPTHALRGRFLAATGDSAGARVSLRRALELDVDLPGVLPMLLEHSPTRADKHAALDFMQALLLDAPAGEDGLLAYRTAAATILGRRELDARLRAIREARPDLGQTNNGRATNSISLRKAFTELRQYARQFLDRRPNIVGYFQKHDRNSVILTFLALLAIGHDAFGLQQARRGAAGGIGPLEVDAQLGAGIEIPARLDLQAPRADVKILKIERRRIHPVIQMDRSRNIG